MMSTLSSEARNSEILHRKRRLLSPRLWTATHRLWNHPDAARIYPCLLFRSYCNARATVPLLQAAAARLEGLSGVDPAAARMLDFFLRFIPEETGHDEWLLEDLEALGFSRREVMTRIPPPSIAALVGAQYYWISHHHPGSVLGFVFLSETSAPRNEQVEDLIERTRLPRSAFRTLLRHAVLDVRHGADVEEVVDSLPLTSDHLAMIGVSLAYSINCLAQSAEEIVDLHELRMKSANVGDPSQAVQLY